MDNLRPHKPTFVTAMVAVLLIIVLYHFTLARRKR